jgi:large subunit ribosomal protein L4
LRVENSVREKTVQATIYNLAGEEAGSIDLDDAIFGVTPNMAVIQQAVLRQQANARQGTHETKTRAQVRGGGRKPWRQKGTGRARQGSTRSPQWTKGGVVFGPHVRSYEQDMPRKMRRLAVRGVLSAKMAEGRVVIVESFTDLEPRTKSMVDTLGKLNVGTESALIMVADGEDNLRRAAGNLPRVTLQPAAYMSIVDMLKHEFIIMPRAAVEMVQTILSNGGGRRKLSLTRDGSGNGDGSEATMTATETETEAPAPKAPRKAEAQAPAAAETEEAPAEEAEAAAPTKRRTSRKAAAAKAEAAPEETAADNVAFEPTRRVNDAAEATMVVDETAKDAPASTDGGEK